MGRILDISGQPFDFDDEMQSRSDELAMVMKRTQEHPSSGVTPNRAAQMLRDAERGDLTAQADLAFDMEERTPTFFRTEQTPPCHSGAGMAHRSGT